MASVTPAATSPVRQDEGERVALKIDLLRCLIGIALLAAYLPITFCGIALFALCLYFQTPYLIPEVSGRLYLPRPDLSVSLALNLRSLLVPYGPGLVGCALGYTLLFTGFGKRWFPILLAKRRLRGAA